MTPELKARIKSFSWQLFYMVAGAVLTFAMSPAFLDAVKAYAPKWAYAMPILVALVTQISKHINNKMKESELASPTRDEDGPHF